MRQNFTVALYEQAREEAREVECEAAVAVRMSLAFRA
jgi:hypothetical protein